MVPAYLVVAPPSINVTDQAHWTPSVSSQIEMCSELNHLDHTQAQCYESI